MRLDRRLELRINTDDLARWQSAARGSGHRAIADWIRTSLNHEAACLSGPYGSAEEKGHPAFQKTTLENGVRIVTESIPGAASIATGVFVDCGWRDEQPRETGLALLCQRMLLKGTSSRDAQQIASEIDAAGGHLTGFTGRDYTSITALVPPARRNDVLDLLGDIFLNSTFPAELLQCEQQLLNQQAAASLDHPANECEERMKNAAWGGVSRFGNPSAMPGTGLHTREDAIYFLERHYSPNRIIVAAAGRVEHEDFVAQARDSYWRMIGESDAAPLARPAFREGLSLDASAAGQSYFSLGFEAPGFAHSASVGVEILISILGGAESSRLRRSIAQSPALACEIHAGQEAFREAGMLVINGQTAAPGLHACVARVMECVSALASWREPVSVEELELAKQRARARHQLEAQAPATRLQRIATEELYFGRHTSLQQKLAEIDAVDLNLLRRLISGEWRAALRRPCVAVLSPQADAGWEAGLRRAIRTELETEYRMYEFEARIA